LKQTKKEKTEREKRIPPITDLPGEDLGNPKDLKVYCVIECDQNEIIVDATENDPINPVWKHRAHLYFFFPFFLSVLLSGISKKIFWSPVMCRGWTRRSSFQYFAETATTTRRPFWECALSKFLTLMG